MKKVSIMAKGMEYKDCYFIDSLDSYREYLVELNNRFAVSESEIKNVKTFVGHGHSMLTWVAGSILGMPDHEEGRKEMLFNLKLLHGRVLHDQLKDVLAGKKLVINNKGGYFPINPGERFEMSEDASVPYTEKDININKWYGGSHYYAKVGNIDVVSPDGDVKWNSEERAMEEARRFLSEMHDGSRM